MSADIILGGDRAAQPGWSMKIIWQVRSDKLEKTGDIKGSEKP